MNQNSNEQVAGHTRTLQIIILALAGGVFLLAGVFAVTESMGDVDRFDIPVLLAVGSAVMAAGMRGVVPLLVTKSGLEQIARREPEKDVEQVCGLFITGRIIAAALLEGAAMYNIVTFKIAHNPLNLGVGITLGVAIMAHVPTQYQMQTWVEERLRELQELRATNW